MRSLLLALQYTGTIDVNRSTHEELNVEEKGIENIIKTLTRMTPVRMMKTMVMRPVVNGDSGTSGRGFCKEEEIVGTWFRGMLVGANP